MSYEKQYPFIVVIKDVGTVRGVLAYSQYHAIEKVYFAYMDKQRDRRKYKAIRYKQV